MKTKFTNHKHTWIVTSIAILLAVITIIVLPENKGFSILFLGIAGGHFIIALIAIFTGWILIPQKFINKLWKRTLINGYDFGWSPKWLYSFIIASVLLLMLAIHLYFSFEGSSILQLILYSVIFLLSINLFIGFIILQNSNRKARITLPMVTLLTNGSGKVLDAGCGAGRTTIALAEAIPGANIIAFDRFDAGYIDGGGIDLLKKNIKLAGIEQQVSIEKGDITSTLYPSNHLDAIVSSYMFDHLGPHKQDALAESYRILKPGGRFLLIVVVRGYSTFGIANIFSLLLVSRAKWIKWIEQTGFKMVSDGKINEGAFFCFEK